MIKIIIADDHKMFLAGLVALLNRYDEVNIVATAENGEEVLKLLETNSVDLVLTDIDMPVMDGIKLTREINKRNPNTNILVLTMHNSGNVISGLVKQGITGYILKNSVEEELIEAIRAVAKGETYYSEEVKEALMNKVGLNKKEAATGAFPALSKRETDVLNLIAKAYSQQQIAETLFISENTVKTHKKSLFSKFDVNNTMALVTAAKERGLLD